MKRRLARFALRVGQFCLGILLRRLLSAHVEFQKYKTREGVIADLIHNKDTASVLNGEALQSLVGKGLGGMHSWTVNTTLKIKRQFPSEEDPVCPTSKVRIQRQI